MFVSKFYRGKSYLRESAGGDILVLSSFGGRLAAPSSAVWKPMTASSQFFVSFSRSSMALESVTGSGSVFFLMEDFCYTLSIEI